MEQGPPQLEKFYISSVEQYLSVIKSEKICDCYSALQYLAQKDHFNDKKIIVRLNVAEQIRDRYKVSKRAFYGANRLIDFTQQTTLDVGEQL
jgi:hypothetical protein